MNQQIFTSATPDNSVIDCQLEYNVTEIKPYSNKELAGFYGISCKIFIKWLLPFSKEIGTKIGRYYTVKQVQVIFSKLGMPYKLK